MNTKNTFYYSLLVFLLFAGGCGSVDSDGPDPWRTTKLVPDQTVFIASSLEMTPDTVHHYPEVYVGWLTDPLDVDYGLKARQSGNEPGGDIWWPINQAQVRKFAYASGVEPIPNDNAKVSVTGPLGTQQEQKVEFVRDGAGVYGDQQYTLEILEGERYRLEVELQDGRSYAAYTNIPAVPSFPLPDTLETKASISQNSSGRYNEIGDEPIIFPFTPVDNAVYSVMQVNKENDAELFLYPGEVLAFHDRGHFLRSGYVYFIKSHGYAPEYNALRMEWKLSTKHSFYETMKVWVRISEIGPELAKFYEAESDFIYHPPDDPWTDMNDLRLNAYGRGDSTYIPSISNILKRDENGEILPKEQSDAVGVFGGYSSVYRLTVMKPLRSWDPDTLNWQDKDSISTKTTR